MHQRLKYKEPPSQQTLQHFKSLVDLNFELSKYKSSCRQANKAPNNEHKAQNTQKLKEVNHEAYIASVFGSNSDSDSSSAQSWQMCDSFEKVHPDAAAGGAAATGLTLTCGFSCHCRISSYSISSTSFRIRDPRLLRFSFCVWAPATSWNCFPHFIHRVRGA